MGLFSKKLNPKDFAYNSVLTFKSQQRDDFSDDSFTFRHANIVITLAMAQNWFGNNLVDVNQAFKGTNLKVSQLPDWSQEMKVNKTLLDTEKTFAGVRDTYVLLIISPHTKVPFTFAILNNATVFPASIDN